MDHAGTPRPPVPPAATPRPARIARWIDATDAEGPFLRSAIWFQGCPIRCPGCCNPELFDAVGGTLVGPEAAARRFDEAAVRHRIEGVTFVGGEPLAQPWAVTWLARQAAARGLGVVLFTGFSREDLMRRPAFRAALECIDTVVAGPYDRTRPERRRAFVGSRNQVLVHRTARYADPALWYRPTPAEIRVVGGRLEIVGRPDAVERLCAALRRPPAPC